MALSSIGSVYMYKGNQDSTLKYLNEAFNILEKHKLTHGKAEILKALEEIENQ